MSGIRKIIREELESIFEDFRYRYDGNFYPDQNVVSTAKKALESISRNDLTNNSGTNEGSGVNKAKSLTSGEPVNHAQLKRMKAFFDNNYEAVMSERSGGKNIETSGLLQTWDLWGGDAGKIWAERMINQRHSGNATSKKVRNASGIRTKTLMDPNNTRIRR